MLDFRGFWIWAAAIASSIIVLSVIAGGADATGWLYAARYTARWSFVVFLAAFLGPALARFDEARTREAILAFGAVHGIHLGALVTYRVVAGEAPPLVALVVGGLAYALIAALIVAEVRGRSGPRLRAAAMSYAWFVFVVTYADRLGAAETRWVGIVGVGVGVAAVAVRVGAWVGAKTRGRFAERRLRH